MATQPFTRLLDLPVEPHTKVWEDAIFPTVPGRWRRMFECLEIEFHATDRAPTSFKDDVRFPYDHDGRTDVRVPHFVNVMGTGHFPRLVTLKWWKRILNGCKIEDLDCYHRDVLKGYIRSIDRLIRDVRANSMISRRQAAKLKAPGSNWKCEEEKGQEEVKR